MSDLTSISKVVFRCRICGGIEVVCAWNPMLVTEICARHDGDELRDDVG